MQDAAVDNLGIEKFDNITFSLHCVYRWFG